MMIEFPNILLARDGDDSWVGILFFLVPFVLWALGTLAQKRNQKQAEVRRQRLREMMEQPAVPTRVRQEPPPPPMRPTRVGPMPVPPPRTQPAPLPRRTVSAPPARPAPLPIPPPKRKPQQPKVPARAPREEVILQEMPRARSVQAPGEVLTERPKPPARALAIHQWLTPQTLRQQFILTELFQPPLALRPPREESI